MPAIAQALHGQEIPAIELDLDMSVRRSPETETHGSVGGELRAIGHSVHACDARAAARLRWNGGHVACLNDLKAKRRARCHVPMQAK